MNFTKKNVLIGLVIIIIVAASYLFEYFYHLNPKDKAPEPVKVSDKIDSSSVKSTSKVDNRPSTTDTVTEKDIPFDQLESDVHNNDAIFFDGMEKVYSVLKFNDVEELKSKLTFYIKNNLTRQANECKVSIVDNSQNVLVLLISVANNSFNVNIPKDKPLEFTIDIKK